jgi:hypothetical protein
MILGFWDEMNNTVMSGKGVMAGYVACSREQVGILVYLPA